MSMTKNIYNSDSDSGSIEFNGEVCMNFNSQVFDTFSQWDSL